MSTIVTLTMNPAIDLYTSVDHVQPERKLRCGAGQRGPGGGGINVSRVVQRLGAATTAVYPAGGLVGQQLQELVGREGVHSRVVPIAGETREDFTVLDEGSSEQYRFVMRGPRLSGSEWMACLKALANLPTRPDFICASGSLPPGVPDDFYARVAEIASGLGAKLALDTSGAPLKAALDEHVHLIKPNLRELQDLSGAALDDEASLLRTCRGLIDQNRVEAVALTLGAQGAVLVTREGAWRSRPVAVSALSAVGAGDSFLGAMIWAWASGKDVVEAFRYGAAGGAAAVMAAGVELSRPQDIHRLAGEVVVAEVSGTAGAA